MSGLVNFGFYRGCPFSKLVWTYSDHIVLYRGQMYCFHYRYGSYFLVQTDEIIIIAFNSAIDNVYQLHRVLVPLLLAVVSGSLSHSKVCCDCLVIVNTAILTDHY